MPQGRDQPYFAGRAADLGTVGFRTDGAMMAAKLLLDTVGQGQPPVST